jgi:hypothetical protein
MFLENNWLKFFEMISKKFINCIYNVFQIFQIFLDVNNFEKNTYFDKIVYAPMKS